MLDDYIDLLQQPVTPEQAAKIVPILAESILGALRVIPHTPETRPAQDILFIGFFAAVSVRFSGVMTTDAFFQQLNALISEPDQR